MRRIPSTVVGPVDRPPCILHLVLGPSYLNEHGDKVGGERGWPAIVDMEPPTIPGAYRLIRPNPSDLRANFQRFRRWNERKALADFREQYRRLLARRRVQRAAKAAIGYRALVERSEAMWLTASKLDDEIEELPATSAPVAAMQIAVQAVPEVAALDHPFDASTLIALRYLLPDVAEPVAADIREIVDHPGRPIGELRIVRGWPPTGEVAA